MPLSSKGSPALSGKDSRSAEMEGKFTCLSCVAVEKHLLSLSKPTSPRTDTPTRGRNAFAVSRWRKARGNGKKSHLSSPRSPTARKNLLLIRPYERDLDC